MSLNAQIGNRLLERVEAAGGVLPALVMLDLVELVAGAVPGSQVESHLLNVLRHTLQMVAVARVHDDFFPALCEGDHVSGEITLIALLEIYLHVERIPGVNFILLPAFSVGILRLCMLHV